MDYYLKLGIVLQIETMAVLPSACYFKEQARRTTTSKHKWLHQSEITLTKTDWTNQFDIKDKHHRVHMHTLELMNRFKNASSCYYYDYVIGNLA